MNCLARCGNSLLSQEIFINLVQKIYRTILYSQRGSSDVLSKRTLEDLVRKYEEKKLLDIMFYI